MKKTKKKDHKIIIDVDHDITLTIIIPKEVCKDLGLNLRNTTMSTIKPRTRKK